MNFRLLSFLFNSFLPTSFGKRSTFHDTFLYLSNHPFWRFQARKMFTVISCSLQMLLTNSPNSLLYLIDNPWFDIDISYFRVSNLLYPPVGLDPTTKYSHTRCRSGRSPKCHCRPTPHWYRGSERWLRTDTKEVCRPLLESGTFQTEPLKQRPCTKLITATLVL